MSYNTRRWARAIQLINFESAENVVERILRTRSWWSRLVECPVSEYLSTSERPIYCAIAGVLEIASIRIVGQTDYCFCLESF